MKKSTQLACITLLIVGIQTPIAAARTVEFEANSSSATEGAKILAETNRTPETQFETDWFQEVELSSAPIPEIATSETALPPKTLAELDRSPRTLREAGFTPDPIAQQTAPSQDPIAPETAPSLEAAQNSPLRFTPRIGGEFNTGPGTGYESSYGAIEGFLPLRQTLGQNLTFLEGRMLIATDNGQLGGNIIIGHRFYSSSSDRTFGGYLAYDIRDTGNTTFNQLGAGFETLGDVVDFRVNGYIPIGNDRKKVRETSLDSAPSLSSPAFQGNFLAQLREVQRRIDRRFEAAMTGFDAEAGVKIAQLGTLGYLRGFAGVYYYDAPGSSSIVGGRGRLELRPSDFLRLGLSVQGDRLFGTSVILTVGASFPGTAPRGARTEDRVLARMGESVFRQQNIVVNQQQEIEFLTLRETVLATNSAGQALFFRHVLGGGTGDGTFENPFGTLQSAQDVAVANDIIYVRPGTNAGSPTSTRSLPDGVRLLSSAVVQQVETSQGTIQLPGSGSGARPKIAGAIALGSNNVVSGFEINGAVGPAIRGTNINNTTIRDNIIANSTLDPTNPNNPPNPFNLGEGINLINATGRIEISNNTIRDNSETAILINNNTGQVDLRIGSNGRNEIANNFNGISVNLLGSARGTGEIVSNSITNSGIGVDVNLGESANASNLSISNNTINGQTQGTNLTQGIRLQASDNAQATVTVSNNTLSNFTGDGMQFALNQSNASSRTQLTISGNTIDTVTDDGIDIELANNAVATVSIANNRISNSGDLNNPDPTVFGTGIEVETLGSSQLQLLIESNPTITRSTYEGIFINSLESSQISTSVRLNTITGNNTSTFATGGFNAQASDTSRICLQLRNNTSDTFALTNNSTGTFQTEVATNTGTVNPTGTTAAPPFAGCTVP